MISVTFVIKLYFDTLIKRVPLAGNIYTAIKQITETFSKTDSSSQKVVMFEYPRKGIQAIGFMTGHAKGEIRDKAGIEMVNVFVPTTPNPTSGFLLFVPKEELGPFFGLLHCFFFFFFILKHVSSNFNTSYTNSRFYSNSNSNSFYSRFCRKPFFRLFLFVLKG